MTTSAKPLITLDPTSGPLDRKDPRQFPERPKALNGAVVGLVVNGIGASEKLFEALYRELQKEAEVVGAIKVIKGSVSVPPEKGDWARLTSEATVAITGFGG